MYEIGIMLHLHCAFPEEQLLNSSRLSTQNKNFGNKVKHFLTILQWQHKTLLHKMDTQIWTEQQQTSCYQATCRYIQLQNENT